MGVHKEVDTRDPRIADWLKSYPKSRGLHRISYDLPYDHREEDYDAQYKSEAIDSKIGPLILDAAGFTPKRLLEVACGTGHMTASLVADGRVKNIVATDGSAAFLDITRAKVGPNVDLALLSDADFDVIPQGLFDAIVMRSALHHFTDFKRAAKLLIDKLAPGGGLFIMEPRADFHITAALILKAVQAKASAMKWSERHTIQTQRLIDAATFYLDRKLDKSAAEDKYVFHLDEMHDIARLSGSTLKVIGGEYPNRFSGAFHDFIVHCEQFDDDVSGDVMALAQGELAFADHAYSYHSGYAAAEWFLFKKP